MLDQALLDAVVDAEAAALAAEMPDGADLRRLGGERGLAECRGRDLAGLLALRDAAKADRDERRPRGGAEYAFWRERHLRTERVLEIANAASFELGHAMNFPPSSLAMGKALGLLATA